MSLINLLKDILKLRLSSKKTESTFEKQNNFSHLKQKRNLLDYSAISNNEKEKSLRKKINFDVVSIKSDQISRLCEKKSTYQVNDSHNYSHSQYTINETRIRSKTRIRTDNKANLDEDEDKISIDNTKHNENYNKIHEMNRRSKVNSQENQVNKDIINISKYDNPFYIDIEDKSEQTQTKIKTNIINIESNAFLTNPIPKVRLTSISLPKPMKTPEEKEENENGISFINIENESISDYDINTKKKSSISSLSQSESSSLSLSLSSPLSEIISKFLIKNKSYIERSLYNKSFTFPILINFFLLTNPSLQLTSTESTLKKEINIKDKQLLSSFSLLNNNKWLNCDILSSYISVLKEKNTSNYLIFNCYFMKILSKIKTFPSETDIEVSKDFLKASRLLSKQLNLRNISQSLSYKLIFPLNIQNMHWVLCEVNLENEEIRVYDSFRSLTKGNTQCYNEILYKIKFFTRQYKHMYMYMYLNKGKTLTRLSYHKDNEKNCDDDCCHHGYSSKVSFTDDDKVSIVFQDCPQQSNSYDCGLYVLKFIECLIDGDDRFERLFNENISSYFEFYRVEIGVALLEYFQSDQSE